MVQTNVVPRLLQSWDYVLLLTTSPSSSFIGNYFKKYFARPTTISRPARTSPGVLASISVWLSSFSATFSSLLPVGVQVRHRRPVDRLGRSSRHGPGDLLLRQRWRRARVITPLGFPWSKRFNKVAHQVFVWTASRSGSSTNALRILATAIFLVPGHRFELVQPAWTSWIVGIIMVVFYPCSAGPVGGHDRRFFFQFWSSGLAVVVFFIMGAVDRRRVHGPGPPRSQASPDIPQTFFHSDGPPVRTSSTGYVFAFPGFPSLQPLRGLVQKYNCVAPRRTPEGPRLGNGALLSFLGRLIFLLPGHFAARAYLPPFMGTVHHAAERRGYVLMALQDPAVGLMGVLVAGMCSATLNTLANEYNVLFRHLTTDFYGKIIRARPRTRSPRQVGALQHHDHRSGGDGVFFRARACNISRQVFNLIDILGQDPGLVRPAINAPLISRGSLFKKVNARGAITGGHHGHALRRLPHRP